MEVLVILAAIVVGMPALLIGWAVSEILQRRRARR